jgi:hypothetical protein
MNGAINLKSILDAARRLSASELESLISDLAEIRAEKTPEVMRRPPQLTDEDIRVIPQDDPSIEARVLRDGRIRLWIRHGGLGWLVFNLSRQTNVVLRDYFIANTDPDERPDLVGQQGGSKH